MAYHPGLLAWLRGLRQRPTKNEIDLNDAADKRYSTVAKRQRFGEVKPEPDSRPAREESRKVIFLLSSLGSRVLRENP